MLYFRRNGEVIEKYQVDFDKEEIEKLKEKIINNCSFIEHEEYESDYSPRFTDEIIKKFTSTPTGKVKEYFEEIRVIYHYSYDKYKPPYLVKLINQLFDGNSKAIDEILNYDISTKSSIDDRINIVNQELIEMDPENITKRKAKLKELEDLLNAKNLNKNQQNIDVYYNQLVGLIKFNLIDTLQISELSRIESFLGIKLSDVDISNSNGDTFVKSFKKVD